MYPNVQRSIWWKFTKLVCLSPIFRMEQNVTQQPTHTATVASHTNDQTALTSQHYTIATKCDWIYAICKRLFLPAAARYTHSACGLHFVWIFTVNFSAGTNSRLHEKQIRPINDYAYSAFGPQTHPYTVCVISFMISYLVRPFTVPAIRSGHPEYRCWICAVGSSVRCGLAMA